jgi:predicted small secreted protein
MGVISCADPAAQHPKWKSSSRLLGKKGSPMSRKTKLTIAIAAAALAVLGAMAVYTQNVHAQNTAAQKNDAQNNNDKYSLISPGGIAFSDFRGYEDWAVVSSARTDEVLKVIVANPTMIKAYKAGIPGNGQSFPDGSKIVKLQWKPKKSTEAPFVVDVPDVFREAFVIEKDSKRFPKSGGWGYAVFNYDAASDKFTPDPKALSDCGHACHTVVKAKDYIFHPYQKR